MDRYQKIIAGTTSISKLIEQGFTQEEIKAAVIESLNPFFENKLLLKKLAIEHLIPHSITIEKIKEDGRFIGVLGEILKIYRSALKSDPTVFYKSIALLDESIAQSQSKFWSVYNLEVDKAKLPIHELLHESMRNIGDFIEELAKPYLLSLLFQIRIIEKKDLPKDISKLDLGNIIHELICKTNFGDFFAPAPWNISLNQWRNISRHGSANVENNQVVCYYGKAPKIKTVQISRDELIAIVRITYMSFVVLKTAHVIFTIDNLTEISKNVSFTKDVKRWIFCHLLLESHLKGLKSWIIMLQMKKLYLELKIVFPQRKISGKFTLANFYFHFGFLQTQKAFL